MRSVVRNVQLFDKMYLSFPLIFLLASFVFCDTQGPSNYYGKYIAALKSYHHALQGDVFVVDSRTLHIRNFNYDGEGPAGYFYVSNGKVPDENGIKLRDERGSYEPLKRYRKKHITLTLPEGKTIHNIKWFYVWCDEFSVNFGDVKLPKNLDFPKPQKIGKLNGVHSVSSDNVVVVDAQTLLIPSFSYDGEAPDAKFWVGTREKPTAQGIRVPDENGKEEPLRRYDKKTIVLTLPGDVTVFDIGNFAIWCEAFTVDFGHIIIPKELNIPPSLKMLGVSPQSKLNCEILHDDLAFEVRWAVAGDSIVIQLVAKLEKGEYMSFGLSGQIDHNVMIGGDVVVAWIDQETLNGFAYDYYLDGKSQCAGNHGTCPDKRLKPNSESIRLLNAALVNGYSIITYQRPLRAHDDFDLPIYTNGSQAVIWAIGPLNSLQEASYHTVTSRNTVFIDFGRSPQWNCPIPESDAVVANSEVNDNNIKTSTSSTMGQPVTRIQTQTESSIKPRVPDSSKEVSVHATTKKVAATPAPVEKVKPWEIPPIQCYEPEDGIFYAQMGPTGGKHGYSAITGHVGWGIAWYINGLLIPEVNVVRGRTYTFVVEGGLDPETPAKYHPFYITDDPVGGFHYKTPEERARVHIFAGVMQTKDGDFAPIGTGRLCNWTPDQDQPPSDEFTSFGAYQRTLSLVCDHGEPGVVQWTPDENTPDVVYYQCFSHRYLGWKINVHDSCDKETAASEQITSRVQAYEDDDEVAEGEGELDSKASIQIATLVKHTNTSTYHSKDQPIDYKETTNPVSSTYFINPLLETTALKIPQIYSQNPYIRPPSPQLSSPHYLPNYSPDYHNTQYTKDMMASSSEKPEYDLVSHLNYSSNRPLPDHKHKFEYPYEDPRHRYPQIPLPPPQYHPTDTHIHVLKHPYSFSNPTPSFHKGSFMSQPHHRPTLITKKPPSKHISHGYYTQPLYKIPGSKPIEPQASSSSTRNIAGPALKDIGLTSKGPQVISVPHHITAYPVKKHHHNLIRKQHEETSATKTLMNRHESQIDSKNNGFNPNSIVIEGGFKPITPSAEIKQVAQERISEESNSDDYVDQDLRDSDTENITSQIDSHSKNPFEGKQPELFEPIFIPSPVINEQLKRKESQKKTQGNKSHKMENEGSQVWPTLYDTTSGAIPQTKNKGNLQYDSLPTRTISYTYFNSAKQSEDDSSAFNNPVKKVYQLPIMSVPYTGVVHNYKVTEIENEHSNNDSTSSERNSINETTSNLEIQENNTRNSQDSLSNDQFVIKIVEEENNDDSLNTTIINL